jgi:hypothetical protein
VSSQYTKPLFFKARRFLRHDLQGVRVLFRTATKLRLRQGSGLSDQDLIILLLALNQFDRNAAPLKAGQGDVVFRIEQASNLRAARLEHRGHLPRWDEKAGPRRDAIRSQWIRTRGAKGDRP